MNLQEKLTSESGDVDAADELTKIIQRHLEEKNIKQLDVTGLNQLDRHLHNFLRQVKIRKVTFCRICVYNNIKYVLTCICFRTDTANDGSCQGLATTGTFTIIEKNWHITAINYIIMVLMFCTCTREQETRLKKENKIMMEEVKVKNPFFPNLAIKRDQYH